MAVLVIADATEQTDDTYDTMLDRLQPLLREADGFIAHGAWPAGGDGWLTFEVWETAMDATRFFATYVGPQLPPGARPKRTLVELHALVLGQVPTLLREHGRDVPTALGAGYR
jgi:hypothetical protein